MNIIHCRRSISCHHLHGYVRRNDIVEPRPAPVGKRKCQPPETSISSENRKVDEGLIKGYELDIYIYKITSLVSTHLKNMLVKLDHFPRVWGEHKNISNDTLWHAVYFLVAFKQDRLTKFWDAVFQRTDSGNSPVSRGTRFNNDGHPACCPRPTLSRIPSGGPCVTRISLVESVILRSTWWTPISSSWLNC